MPDVRLTLANLKEHLRRHLAIYIAGAILALVLSNLLWTVTAPRIPSSQSVLIYLAGSYSNAGQLSPIARDMLERTQAQDPSLRGVTFEGLRFADDAMDYTSTILLMTRLAAGEGDAFLASAAAMEALVNSGGALPLDGYVDSGWLTGYGLEPYWANETDEITGVQARHIYGLRLDRVEALAGLGAFDNAGACLAVATNSDNLETTLRTLEVLIEDLTAIAGAEEVGS